MKKITLYFLLCLLGFFPLAACAAPINPHDDIQATADSITLSLSATTTIVGPNGVEITITHRGSYADIKSNIEEKHELSEGSSNGFALLGGTSWRKIRWGTEAIMRYIGVDMKTDDAGNLIINVTEGLEIKK